MLTRAGSLLAVSLLLFSSFAAPCRAEETSRFLRYGPNAPVMPQGRFRGRPLDVRERMPLVILTGADRARYRPAETDLVVANIFHEGRFWIGRIPVDGVDGAFFQNVHFPSGFPFIEAGHDQWMFTFRRGSEVELFPYEVVEMPRTAQLSELIFSTEAVPVRGDSYGLVRGLGNRFVRTVRCMSWEEVWIKWVTSNQATIPQWRIDQPPEMIRQMLVNAINNSDRMGLDEMYNTIFGSCVTDAFGLVDGNVRYNVFQRMASTLRVLPMLPATYLRFRGLISHADYWRNPTPTFNAMFVDRVDESEFQRRHLASARLERADREVFLREQAAEAELRGRPWREFCREWTANMAAMGENMYWHR